MMLPGGGEGGGWLPGHQARCPEASPQRQALGPLPLAGLALSPAPEPRLGPCQPPRVPPAQQDPPGLSAPSPAANSRLDSPVPLMSGFLGRDLVQSAPRALWGLLESHPAAPTCLAKDRKPGCRWIPPCQSLKTRDYTGCALGRGQGAGVKASAGSQEGARMPYQGSGGVGSDRGSEAGSLKPAPRVVPWRAR